MDRHAQPTTPPPQPQRVGPTDVERALRAALEEQRTVAEFGQDALRGVPLDELLERSVDLVRDSLEVEYTGVLEHRADEGELVMLAGRG